MKWFKHLSSMLDDPWVQDVFMAQHGLQGYGFLCGIYEIYAKECGNDPGCWISIPTKTVERKLRVSVTKVERWLHDCSIAGKLTFEIVLRELRICIPKMQELRDEWSERQSKKLGSSSGETHAKKKKKEEEKEFTYPSGKAQNAPDSKKEKTLICGEPSACEPAAATPAHPIWGDVLDLLVTNGEKESSARTFLGRALKEYGENSLNEVSSRLILEQPVNPKAFMMGLLSQQKKKSASSTKPDSLKVSIEQTIREAWVDRKVIKHHIAGNFHPEALTPVNAAFQEVDIEQAYGLKTPTGDTFAVREWRIVE